MGYGEYGGGGSVHWTVIHGGDGRAENGRDPEPKKNSSGGFNNTDEFIVIIDGKEFRTKINGNHDQIRIYWPPHDPNDPKKADKMKELEPKINEARRKNADADRAAGGTGTTS